jgi:hypothetical protein
MRKKTSNKEKRGVKPCLLHPDNSQRFDLTGKVTDHPLDSANKYMNHSFVESPEMKNVYDGVAVLDT